MEYKEGDTVLVKTKVGRPYPPELDANIVMIVGGWMHKDHIVAKCEEGETDPFADLLEACELGFQLVLGRLGELRAKYGDKDDCRYCQRDTSGTACAGHLLIETLQNRAMKIDAAIKKSKGGETSPAP